MANLIQNPLYADADEADTSNQQGYFDVEPMSQTPAQAEPDYMDANDTSSQGYTPMNYAPDRDSSYTNGAQTIAAPSDAYSHLTHTTAAPVPIKPSTIDNMLRRLQYLLIAVIVLLFAVLAAVAATSAMSECDCPTLPAGSRSETTVNNFTTIQRDSLNVVQAMVAELNTTTHGNEQALTAVAAVLDLLSATVMANASSTSRHFADLDLRFNLTQADIKTLQDSINTTIDLVSNTSRIDDVTLTLDDHVNETIVLRQRIDQAIMLNQGNSCANYPNNAVCGGFASACLPYVKSLSEMTAQTLLMGTSEALHARIQAAASSNIANVDGGLRLWDTIPLHDGQQILHLFADATYRLLSHIPDQPQWSEAGSLFPSEYACSSINRMRPVAFQPRFANPFIWVHCNNNLTLLEVLGSPDATDVSFRIVHTMPAEAAKNQYVHVIANEDMVIYSDATGSSDNVTLATINTAATGGVPSMLKSFAIGNAITQLASGAGRVFITTVERNAGVYYFSPSEGADATLRETGQVQAPVAMVWGSEHIYTIQRTSEATWNIRPVDFSMGIPQLTAPMSFTTNATFHTLTRDQNIMATMISCDILGIIFNVAGRQNRNACAIILYNISAEAEIYETEFEAACNHFHLFRNRLYLATTPGMRIY
eukprot:TRINITY_DN6606_c0_g1_i1.p1 TRINITY_DN6606_c0_g1~~TRINITY_DN6606_c0_g1_i1.p1  ORF type:complete len:651 (+),score=152.31 TRINITY_DN6606_c0_g1_i1:102-2054(+)